MYSDEDKLSPTGERCVPSLKPDWSPDLLLSSAYFCHMLVVRRSLVTELGGLRSEFDGSQDYDLMLRATEVARDGRARAGDPLPLAGAGGLDLGRPAGQAVGL